MNEPELDLLVRRLTWEAEGVLSVELVHPDGKPLPAWRPGAHLDLHLGGHLRQYSLCSDAQDPSYYRVGVLNEVSSRGGSRYVHTRLRPGDTVRTVGPRNNFALEEAAEYRFVAGGIGVTPLVAMVREAVRAGRRWRLVHGGRTRASMAFGAELEALAGQSDRVTFTPQDELGHIDLDAALADLPADALVYCCGPEPLLSAVREKCAAIGCEDRLRIERFAAPEPRPAAAASAFEVECSRSGLTVAVDEETSILQAVEQAGVDVPSSCRDGICGTCETRVLEGDPEHRDWLLSDAEHAESRTMMICVSRCASQRLVLDL